MAEDPQRTADLDRAFADLADSVGAGPGVMEWEYLLVVAERV